MSGIPPFRDRTSIRGGNGKLRCRRSFVCKSDTKEVDEHEGKGVL